jgi:hypothetical protein
VELVGQVIRIETTMLEGWANVWMQLSSEERATAILPFPIAVANNFRLGETLRITLSRELVEGWRSE